MMVIKGARRQITKYCVPYDLIFLNCDERGEVEKTEQINTGTVIN